MVASKGTDQFDQKLPGKPEPCNVRVTVLGAGIAGLTAAHELAERGFKVQVIEKERLGYLPGDDTEDPTSSGYEIDVGGVARSQWLAPPDDSEPCFAKGNLPLEQLISLRTASRAWQSEDADTRGKSVTFDFIGEDPTDCDDARLRRLDKAKGAQLVLINYLLVDAEGREIPTDDARFGLAAAWRRLGRIADQFRDPKRKKEKTKFLPPAIQEIRLHDPEDLEETFVGVVAQLYDKLNFIPGEHGYRFFAGFYNHVFDTMQRTPIFDDKMVRFTERTILDNLRKVEWQVLADLACPHPVAFRREPIRGLKDLFDQYRMIRRELGYRPRDLLRFALRFLRFATSCSERRKEQYEHLSWWDFLSIRNLGDSPRTPPVSAADFSDRATWYKDRWVKRNPKRFDFGARFACALRDAPAALVAMHAVHADARTQGNITVQLAMDQFGLHDRTDSTLFAPTSLAWFADWKSYLEKLGVKFFGGVVDRLWLDGTEQVSLDVTFHDRTDPPPDFEFPQKSTDPHYIVCALDLMAARNVVTDLRTEVDENGGVIWALEDFTAKRWFDDNNITRKPDTADDRHPRDRLQTLTGIQYFFPQKITFADGHIYYVGSPWGLSAISQPQFWMPYGQSEPGQHGFISNLSVDIGIWAGRLGKELCASPCAPVRADIESPGDMDALEIATKILEQIDEGRGTDRRFRPRPDPRYFHIDDYIEFTEVGTPRERPIRNGAPLVMSSVSDWDHRPPGEPWCPNHPSCHRRMPGIGDYFASNGHAKAVWRPREGGYLVHFDRLVFAATHMRTLTRLTTMEAANESARHAVNAILDHLVAKFRPQAQAMTLTEVMQSQSEDAFIAASSSSQAEPHNHPTPFGEYCDVWDPEQNEFPNLEFLKEIDEKLVARMKTGGVPTDRPAGRACQPLPHMFDMLRLDDMADFIDTDEHAEAAIHLIASVLQTVVESHSAGGDLLSAAAGLRNKVQLFIKSKIGSG